MGLSWREGSIPGPRARLLVAPTYVSHSEQEPWALRAHPEVGFLTAVALGTEKTWLVVGSSRGFVMLWDLRFQVRSLCRDASVHLEL